MEAASGRICSNLKNGMVDKKQAEEGTCPNSNICWVAAGSGRTCLNSGKGMVCISSNFDKGMVNASK